MPDVAVLRKFLPPDLTTALVSCVEASYAEVDRLRSVGNQHRDFNVTESWDGLAMAHIKQHLRKLDTSAIDKTGIFIESKFPGMRIRDPLSVFRRHRPQTWENSLIRWHTDADGTNSRQYDPVFNLWIPLCPVGRISPSLELIEGSSKYVRSIPPRNPSSCEFSPEEIAEHLPTNIRVCPELDLGDAIIFSHMVIHRTEPVPHPHPVRIGSEFRFSWEGDGSLTDRDDVGFAG